MLAIFAVLVLVGFFTSINALHNQLEFLHINMIDFLRAPSYKDKSRILEQGYAEKETLLKWKISRIIDERSEDADSEEKNTLALAKEILWDKDGDIDYHLERKICLRPRAPFVSMGVTKGWIIFWESPESPREPTVSGICLPLAIDVLEEVYRLSVASRFISNELPLDEAQ
jgi:hypothetical protein